MNDMKEILGVVVICNILSNLTGRSMIVLQGFFVLYEWILFDKDFHLPYWFIIKLNGKYTSYGENHIFSYKRAQTP